jgi:hypothetical protein
MVAVVVIEAVALVLLGVLVAGLLRSHAEILRALHRLGAGLEGPDAEGRAAASGAGGLGLGPTRFGSLGNATTPGGGNSTGGPAHDVSGIAPHGGAVHVALAGTGRATLLAFLTSGCTTCGAFWSTFSRPGGFELPGFVDRLVVVTKGTDRESPSEVLALAPKASSGIPVVMSNDAWGDYEVPVSPYFVLVDGRTDRVAGEGAARSWDQLQGLLARAVAESAAPVASGEPAPPARAAQSAQDAQPAHAGTAREADDAANDRRGRPRRERADDALAAAGIDPGHPSLHPRP